MAESFDFVGRYCLYLFHASVKSRQLFRNLSYLAEKKAFYIVVPRTGLVNRNEAHFRNRQNGDMLE